MKPMVAPTLLVLAAGMGSRYGGLKQIDSVGPNGETIVDYSIFDAIRAGFGKVVFVISREIEQQFKEAVGARLEEHVTVEYVFQQLAKLPRGFSVPAGRSKPWGTMHAVLVASEAIGEPFAVINGDDFYGAESYRLLAQHLCSGTKDYAMVGFVLRNTLSDFGAVSRGVCQVSSGGFLEGVVELTNIKRHGSGARNVDATGHCVDLSGDEIVSMNMWGFTAEVFEQLKEELRNFLKRSGTDLHLESYLPSMVNDVVSMGHARVRVLQTNDPWVGVTYREDRPRVLDYIGRLIQSGVYPKRLWE